VLLWKTVIGTLTFIMHTRTKITGFLEKTDSKSSSRMMKEFGGYGNDKRFKDFFSNSAQIGEGAKILMVLIWVLTHFIPLIRPMTYIRTIALPWGLSTYGETLYLVFFFQWHHRQNNILDIMNTFSLLHIYLYKECVL